MKTYTHSPSTIKYRLLKPFKKVFPGIPLFIASCIFCTAVQATKDEQGEPKASPLPQPSQQQQWVELFSSSEFSLQEWLQNLSEFLEEDSSVKPQNHKADISEEALESEGH